MPTGIGIGNTPIFLDVGGGLSGSQTYAEILRDTYGVTEIWPLVNISSGTTIPAFINSARNGTESGWTLQNAAGPVTGTLAPLSHGNPATDHGSVINNHQAMFNGDEVTLIIWANLISWLPATLQTLWRIEGSSEWLYLAVQSGFVAFVRNAGAVNKQIVYSIGAAVGWFMIGMTCSVSNNQLKAYVNGLPVGTPQTGLLSWVTPLTKALIGNIAIGSVGSANGHLAYGGVRYGGIATDADMLAIYNAAFTADPD